MGKANNENNPPWFISIEQGEPKIRWKSVYMWIFVVLGTQILTFAAIEWLFPTPSHWSKFGMISVFLGGFVFLVFHFQYRRFIAEFSGDPTAKQFGLPIIFASIAIAALFFSLTRINERATSAYYRDREALVDAATAIVEKGKVRFSGNQNTLMVVVNRSDFDDADLTELLGLMRERLVGRGGIYHLTLSDTSITDASAAELAKCEYLQYLMLDGNAFTDESLQHFAKIEPLKLLSLSRTNVSQSGLERLRQQRPNVNISPIKISTAK